MELQRMLSWAKRAAIKTALKSNFYPHKHGAVVVLGGSILSAGINKATPKHHEASEFSLHAEVDAILKINEKLVPRATIYVARLAKQGRIANSEPCDKCKTFLAAYGVKKVCYSISGINQWGELNLT